MYPICNLLFIYDVYAIVWRILYDIINQNENEDDNN